MVVVVVVVVVVVGTRTAATAGIRRTKMLLLPIMGTITTRLVRRRTACIRSRMW